MIKRLILITFKTDVESAIKESEVIFIDVGTPPAEDGIDDWSELIIVKICKRK